MAAVKIHVFHTGEVRVSPNLAFGGARCSPVKAAGLFLPEEARIWLPVSSYLIEHPRGRFLVDTGWSREMSPEGEFDETAQIRSLGSRLLYRVNQGVVPKGACVDEQLARLGIAVADLDAVLLTHLDCDHANGLVQVAEAPRFLVSKDELQFATKLTSRRRYKKRWWDMVTLEAFDWNAKEGPFEKSFDLLGDGSIQLIAIPGHSGGLFAVKVCGDGGRFALLFSDGGYARKSWDEMVVSGIASNRAQQRESLEWIREQSLDPRCVESLANHDPDVAPHVIEL